jgi:hypothetical protein
LRSLRQRNKDFKRDLPKYRFALRAWMWQDKKRLSASVYWRWMIVQSIETEILDWQVHENFITRSFIEPPDKRIREVLTWN